MGARTEDVFTKQIENYAATIPSSAYLGVAIAAMALSFALELGGRGKWGNFIGQWVPTWLIIGLYNKVVKLEGHDHIDRDLKYRLSSHSSVGSIYGAAGSVVMILLWVYYFAHTLFGAEFTQIYASQFGSGVVPADHAEPLGASGTRKSLPPEDAKCDTHRTSRRS